MPLPGGPANKLGNRYERLWTAYQFLHLLDGRSESVRVEEPGADKAEFVVRRGDQSEFHQAKCAGIRGIWSVASLVAEGVLKSMHEFLADPNARYIFASGCLAGELADLADAARHAESEQEFLAKFLEANSRKKPFERICQEWQCDLGKAFDYLRRVEVTTIGERELEDQVRLYARTLFLADATRILAELLRVVDKSIHQMVRRDELIEAMGRSGFVMRRITNRGQAASAIRQATESYLERARQRLIHRTLVPRTASQTVLEGIGNSATVLIGKAGSGKTACAVEIVEGLVAQGAQILAFRLDRHVSASNAADLGQRLGLEESPALVIASAAEDSGNTGVLVVDQLDAVSTMSGRSSEALDLVEHLLGEVKALRKGVALHVVVVCRSFDWDNDHRLRGLISDSDAQVAVGEFTDEETRELLRNGGFTPSFFKDAQLRQLRLPQNLALFLDAGFSVRKSPNFNTVTELFDRYWDAKRNLVAEGVGPVGDHWMEVLQLLCSGMTAKQELSVRREVLDGIPGQYLARMASEGILVFDNKCYGFGHESFFDYCYARVSFLPGSESLTSMLRSSEQHLFRRGQVRQVLAYIRDADFDRYVSEVRSLLSDSDVRVHIKDLVFALLAEIPDPIEEEWQIWSEWTRVALQAIENGSPSGHRLSELAWRRLLGSEPWFEFLVSRGVVKQWLESGNEGLINMAVEHYLRFHQRREPDTAAKLLEPYVGSGGDWHRRLEAFATWADVSESRRLFDLLLRLIEDGTLDNARGPIAENSTFWSLFHGLEKKQPAWVGELLACRARRRLVILKEKGDVPSNLQLFGHDSRAARMFAKASELAPLAFAKHVLPVVIEISDLTAGGEAPRRDAVWRFLIRTDHPSADDACLEGLTEAMEELADKSTAERREEILGELRRRDTHVANHLFLAFCRGDPNRLGDELVARFCAEPWRFECGFADNGYWCAMKTISAVAPHLSGDNLGLLEQSILRYVSRFEAGVAGRRRRGSTQYALISSIPKALRSKKGQTRFQELERKFGKVPEEPKVMKIELVASPIGSSASEKMSDDQWLKAMKRYSSEEGLEGHGEFFGGAHELSQVLEERVKKEPARFARLAMRFNANMNPAYMQRTLAGLRQVKLDSTSKLDVCRRAFAEYRQSCGREIADAIGSVSGTLPEDAVEMIHWLATEHPDPEQEQWQEEVGDSGKKWNGEVFFHGINTVRGNAAMSIRQLILSDATNLERFRKTIEKLVKDPSSAVLSCVSSIFEAVAVTDPEEAVALFLSMDVPTEELLATPFVMRFMSYSVARSFMELSPLIDKMVRSRKSAVAEYGATLAGLALLHGHAAEGFVEIALAKSEAHRLGIAKVASSNINTRECRDWCERRLLELFEDEAAMVREQAASCFLHLEGEPLEEYCELIDSFSASAAFADDSSSVLTALEDSRQRLPGITCLVCKRHLERFSEESRDFWSLRATDFRTLMKLVFRTYQQHQKDDWAARTLDVIDQLCLEGPGDAAEMFDSFER